VGLARRKGKTGTIKSQIHDHNGKKQAPNSLPGKKGQGQVVRGVKGEQRGKEEKSERRNGLRQRRLSAL